jgi:hypothetical protein
MVMVIMVIIFLICVVVQLEDTLERAGSKTWRNARIAKELTSSAFTVLNDG